MFGGGGTIAGLPRSMRRWLNLLGSTAGAGCTTEEDMSILREGIFDGSTDGCGAMTLAWKSAIFARDKSRCTGSGGGAMIAFGDSGTCSCEMFLVATAVDTGNGA